MIEAYLEQGCLGFSVLAELIDSCMLPGSGVSLFSLLSALRLVPLFLLPLLLFLTLRKG